MVLEQSLIEPDFAFKHIGETIIYKLITVIQVRPTNSLLRYTESICAMVVAVFLVTLIQYHNGI